MNYKILGNTGLKVSSLCLGTMTFGDGADKEMCKDIYSLSRDKGINFFDCANVYADGESERILGQLVQNHRNEVILSTKAYYPTGSNINDKGLSRLHLTKELDNSLKRLKTDYIDVYYLHSFDEDTLLEESLSTLDNFVKQGKILYIGISNFAAWQVMKAISVTQRFNYTSIACIQPMYNLLKRQCETEILPMTESEGLGVVSYGPLAGGMLTGKYLKSGSIQEGRLNVDPMYQKRYLQEVNTEVTERYINFCQKNNYNPIALAIAWVGSHKNITTPIIGARNVNQLNTSLEALDINISDELRTEISNISLAPAIATDRQEEQITV